MVSSSPRTLPRNRKRDPQVQDTQTSVENNTVQRTGVTEGAPPVSPEFSGPSPPAQPLAGGGQTEGQLARSAGPSGQWRVSVKAAR